MHYTQQLHAILTQLALGVLTLSFAGLAAGSAEIFYGCTFLAGTLRIPYWIWGNQLPPPGPRKW